MRGSDLGRFSAGVAAGLWVTTAVAAAPAVALPEWDIAALCGHDSARGQCVLLEREARRTLSGGWEAVPPELRSACLGEVKSPYDKSYRLLSSCLEIKVLKSLDRDLIDTATTAPKSLPAKAAAVAAPPTAKPAPPPAPPPQAAAPAAKPTAVAPAPAPAAPVTVAQAIAWPYLDPAAPSVAEEAQRRAAIAAELAALTAARLKAEAEAAAAAPAPAPAPAPAAPVTLAPAITWPYVEPSAASVAEEAQRRAAIAAELAALTAARQKAETEAAKAAAAKPVGITEAHPFAWPYLDAADAAVAEEAKHRAAIAAELAALSATRAKAEAEPAKAAAAPPPPAAPAATPPPPVATAIPWPYVDPADATVAEEAKRRAAIAAELKSAADARAKAEAAERQAALAAEQEALAAANRKREAARACQSALDAAAKSGVILFKSSSAELEAKSTTTLDRLAAAARSCANLKIRIAGHTDATGPADRNQKLSEDRARTVATYLAGKGVAGAGLESAGFGATKPIASNDTSAGRAKNRRIEFTVSGE